MAYKKTSWFGYSQRHLILKAKNVYPVLDYYEPIKN